MRSIELFAGAGGLGIGLHEAGFHPVNVIERDLYCCDTIRRNQKLEVKSVKDWNVTRCDVRTIDFKEHEGKVDLVSGGPPCQPFSVGGKHQAYNDTRDMFPEAVRVLREAKPKAFIFENVKGLTRTTFRNYYEYIKLQMEHPTLTRKVSELDRSSFAPRAAPYKRKAGRPSLQSGRSDSELRELWHSTTT